MKIKMFLRTRDGYCNAEAIFDGEKTIVLAGAKNPKQSFAFSSRGKICKKILR